MRIDIATLLKKGGPTLSSKIVDELVNTGISRETARKQVSRSSGTVRRLQGIQFPNRERFLFLEDQFGKQIFKSTLSASLKQSNTSYGRALTGLESRGGAVPVGHFAIAGGLPVENTKGQLLATLILSRLLQVGLLKKETSTDREIVSLWNVASISNRRLASLIVEDITLAAIKTWLMNMGWVSTNAIKIRTDHSAPRFGQFPFDIVGPSYLNSIIHYKKGKPVNGFIVADILLDREIKSKDLEPFFSKLSVLANQKRKAHFQPLFKSASRVLWPRLARVVLRGLLRCNGIDFGTSGADDLIGGAEDVLGALFGDRFRVKTVPSAHPILNIPSAKLCPLKP
jgi:hypothetical protein